MKRIATPAPNTVMLEPTHLLDFHALSIARLVEARGWRHMSDYERIRAVYNFVKDEITFGYNRTDAMPASDILKDGYGQCNTKATLLMALLRAVDIPCRFHGFTIDKALQKGAITGFWYRIAPQNIIHSWVEVWYADNWRNLEGVILDREYLTKLQGHFAKCNGTFCGYGAYTDSFRDPPTEWNGTDTYIQSLGINNDFGIFNSPDDFYALHGSNLSGIKQWVYAYVVRKIMNRTIAKIRNA